MARFDLSQIEPGHARNLTAVFRLKGLREADRGDALGGCERIVIRVQAIHHRQADAGRSVQRTEVGQIGKPLARRRAQVDALRGAKHIAKRIDVGGHVKCQAGIVGVSYAF